jgi:hypothetical protein
MPGRRLHGAVLELADSLVAADRHAASNAERSRNVPVNVVSSGLEWREFSAAYFPGRRRHDMQALTAYGAYKRSQVAEPPAPEATGPALEAWEDEGGHGL